MPIFFLFLLVSQIAFTAEVDSITPRKLTLDNSLSSINNIFNQRIQEGVQKANEKQNEFEDIDENEFCDENVLYTELRKAIFQSYTASWGLKGFALDKQLRTLLARQSYSLALKDSIYRDINYLEGFSLNIKELTDIVNINDHLIGLDKIGHFFAEGWKYFELTYEEKYNLNKALEWGKQQETGKFGYATTGIFSFSDLVANFNGWRFWNKILLNEEDPIKGTIANFFNSPYITCKIQVINSFKYKKIIKAWEINTEFNFVDFIDGAWDEGNNCNSYNDPIIEEKISMRAKNVAPSYRCPYSIEQCTNSQQKYGQYAKLLLHPYCLIASEE